MFLPAARDPEQGGQGALLVAVQIVHCMETPRCRKVNVLAANKASCSSLVNTIGMSNLLSSASIT
eukprot:4089938-Pyramimonas_sp.AAC.1